MSDVYHDIVEIENKHELFHRRLARKRQKHIGPKTERLPDHAAVMEGEYSPVELSQMRVG